MIDSDNEVINLSSSEEEESKDKEEAEAGEDRDVRDNAREEAVKDRDVGGVRDIRNIVDEDRDTIVVAPQKVSLFLQRLLQMLHILLVLLVKPHCLLCFFLFSVLFQVLKSKYMSDERHMWQRFWT